MGKKQNQEEVRQLIKLAQDGDKQALDTLVQDNSRLVHYACQSYVTNEHYDDYAQIGFIGLIKAIKNFNFDFTVTFSTYAVPKIKGEINRSIRDREFMRGPKVSRYVLATVFLINRAGYINLDDTTVEEVYEDLKDGRDYITKEIIKDALRFARSGGPVSLEDSFSSGPTTAYNEEITYKELLIGDVNSNWEDRIHVQDAIKTLDERERNIVKLRYYDDLTQRETAEVIGVSQVQISRIENKILAKLKGELEEPEMEARGDRERAIELIKTTNKTGKQIAEETGVPLGSIGRLTKQHRDSHKPYGERPATKRKKAANKRKKQNAKFKPGERFRAKREEEKQKQSQMDRAAAMASTFREAYSEEPTEKKVEQQEVKHPVYEIGKNKSEEDVIVMIPAKEVDDVLARAETLASTSALSQASTANNAQNYTPKTIETTEEPAVTVNLNLNLSGAKIKKSEAIERMRKAADLLELLDSDVVDLDVKVHS